MDLLENELQPYALPLALSLIALEDESMVKADNEEDRGDRLESAD